MTTTRNFLGIPVDGDIHHDSVYRAAQRPVEDLHPALQAVLDDPNVVEFGWTQYTPYFNDGDPCEFSVYGLWLRTPEDVGYDDNRYALELDDHRTMGGYNSVRAKKYQGTWDTARALDNLIQSGAFNEVLLETFGDHAYITVRKDKIEVEAYSHD